jgi:hypothetical protein
MITKASALSFALAAGLLGPRVAGAAATIPDAKEKFFRKINALVAMKILRPVPVAKALGVDVPLEVNDRDAADETFSTFTAPASTASALGRVEIRSWDQPSKDAFVLVEAP